MFSKPRLFFASLAALLAVATSAPQDWSMRWINDRWAQTMPGCDRETHFVKFSEDDNYIKAPTNGAFVYERNGLGFVNLAQVNMDDHFGKKMIPAPEDDGKHGVAAVGGISESDGTANDPATAYLVLRPESKVHAFAVRNITFFCLENRQPVSCTVEFKLSHRTNETNKLSWESIQFRGRAPTFKADLHSWSSPPSTVHVRNVAPLQAFSISLSSTTLTTQENDIANDTTDDEPSNSGITLYIDSVKFVTWKCQDRLPRMPLGGAVKRLLNGAGSLDQGGFSSET